MNIMEQLNVIKQNPIKEKSFQFAVRIVKMYGHLKENKKEYIISKQILRSGTSIGANVREALNGESKPDFIHKLGIAQKETDETLYWLELLRATDVIDELAFTSIHDDCAQLLKMIKSIIISTKQNASAKNNS
jgi:four helix bundle protein